MNLFTTASIDIANDQPALSADTLEELRVEMDRALEEAANAVLDRLGIAQSMMPTIITGDFHQWDGVRGSGTWDEEEP